MIFPDDFPGLQVLTPADFENSHLRNIEFDLVLSLEEEERCALLASMVSAKKLIGVHFNHDGLTYTAQSSSWYDMSLISQKGKVAANALKKSNPFPFQHWLFNMTGNLFSNQPYAIYRNRGIRKIDGLVGIESRVGQTWPNKQWVGYESLEKEITALGYHVKYFRQRENIRDYFDDIASCSCIISGDSLPMHVALAYKIPCIAIFNCTPPSEIHDYGILNKVVSPLLQSNLYSRTYKEEVVNSVSVEQVLNTFKKLALPK